MQPSPSTERCLSAEDWEIKCCWNIFWFDEFWTIVFFLSFQKWLWWLMGILEAPKCVHVHPPPCPILVLRSFMQLYFSSQKASPLGILYICFYVFPNQNERSAGLFSYGRREQRLFCSLLNLQCLPHSQVHF